MVTEIEKVPIFSPKTILLFRVYRVKKLGYLATGTTHIFHLSLTPLSTLMPPYLASNALALMSDLFVDSILRTSSALFPQTMQTRSAGCRFLFYGSSIHFYPML